MYAYLDHVGIVARTWPEAAEVLLDKLGLEMDLDRTPMPDGSYFAPERTNNYFVKVGIGQTRIEILIPADDTSGTAKYLAKRGPGLHHLGYAVPNVTESAAKLRERGLVQIDLGADPDRLSAAFFRPQSVGGILTELVPVRDRATGKVIPPPA
jgi:methylmalonyl-CoA/ethylmalonyl-CoA epimerase